MPEREKVALCLEYPIEQFGGTEVLVRQLIHGLAGRYRIVLVSPDNEAAVKASSVAGKVEQHLFWDPARISAAGSRRLAQAIADSGVRLAHFHFAGNYGWGNRYFNRCPVLFLGPLGVTCLSTNHGAFSIFDGYCGPQRSVLIKGGYFLPAWFSKLRVLSRLKTEIAVSQNDYRSLRRWYWPLRSKFGQIYHSQLQLKESDEATILPAADREKVIICVGTIGLRKGQNILTEAFSRIAAEFPDWKLLLIGRHGDDGVIDRVKAIIAERNLSQQVLLLNKCSDEEVKGWMKKAAVFAMPSYLEGLGLSLQEAQFNCCACVGSRVGGIPELIEHEKTGLLVEPGQPGALADALKTLISNPALRESYGRSGRKAVIEKGMTAGQMIARYVELYESLFSAR